MQILNRCSVSPWVILIITSLTFPQGAISADPAAPTQAIVLNEVPQSPAHAGPILIRELIRQAVLLTAREEFGLLTRDATLGETLPKESKLATPPLEISVASDGANSANVVIRIRKPDGLVELANYRFRFEMSDPFRALTVQVEGHSRKEMVAILEKAGFKRQPIIKPSNAAVPPEILKQLKTLSPILQFAAIRSLHAEIRKSGESPALVGALARAYAMLGSLTELNWSPANKVFNARALLYADRLHAKSTSAESLATRGYVRAFVGLPLLATEDFAEIVKLGAKKTPATGLSAESKLLNAYAYSDAKQISAAAEGDEFKLLATYLNVLRSEATQIQTVRLPYAQALLKLDPGNMRVIESMNLQAKIGTLHQTTVTSPRLFMAALYQELPEVPGLPQSTIDLVKERPDVNEEIIPHVADIMTALRSNGQSDQAGAKRQDDVSEPSLMVLGDLVRDTNFVYVARLLWFRRYFLGVDPDDLLRAFGPLVAGHRYQAYIDSQIWNEQKSREALTTLLRLKDDPHVTAVNEPIFSAMDRRKMTETRTLRVAASKHADLTLRDLIVTSDTMAQFYESAAIKLLPNISPRTGVVITLRGRLAQLSWEEIEQAEKDFPDDPMVIEIVARAGVQNGQPEKALRRLKRLAEVVPDADSFYRLATLYQTLGDEDNWAATLQQAVKLPDQGLMNAGMLWQLAQYKTKKKDLQAAAELADQAAQSGAGGPLSYAAECHERLEEWEKSEQLISGVSQRYRVNAQEWYFWCRRTGRGDLSAAREVALQNLAELEVTPEAPLRRMLAFFYYCEEQDEKSLELLQKIAKLPPQVSAENPEYPGLCAALLADELGKAELRDKLLEEALVAAEGPAFDPYRAQNPGRPFVDLAKKNHLGNLIRAFQLALRPEGAVLFEPRFHEIEAHTLPQEATWRNFCMGKFLYLRGQKEEGQRYLQLAASSPLGLQNGHRWAAMFLARRDIARDPLRTTEWGGDGPLETILELLEKSKFVANRKHVEVGQDLTDKALQLDPNSIDALFVRAKLRAARQLFRQALEDALRLQELLPNSMDIRLRVAHYQIKAGDYSAARDVYEQARKLDPRDSKPLRALVRLYSGCPDEKFRDGKKAMEYAKLAMSLPDPGSEGLNEAAMAMAHSALGDVPTALEHFKLSQKKGRLGVSDLYMANDFNPEYKMPYRMLTQEQIDKNFFYKSLSPLTDW
ncbi:MAG: hypothetical protein JWN70_4132 [Planctomycetaceae bacterium]|nr:hypothetical protein [Planctomycetaceae bacterium]